MKHDDEPTFEKIKRPARHVAMPNKSEYPTCSGKKSFNKRRALNTAKALNKKHGVKQQLYVYKCTVDGVHYHLTSMPRSRYRVYERNKAER